MPDNRLINSQYLTIGFILILASFYYLIFYTLFNKATLILDFTSLYSALLNLVSDRNPYKILQSSFLSVTKELSANLNPPIALVVLSPLTKLNYHNALILWTVASLLLGLTGAWIAYYYAFSKDFLKKNWIILTVVYLSFFSTLMNITTAQLGSLLVFFVMLGYHFYRKKHCYLAGFLWGFIISLKFFPALLFFYVAKEGRLKVALVMLATLLTAFLIPLLLYGSAIYSQYFLMMSHIFWYGDNWNASVYGYLFRLFNGVFHIDLLYAGLFFLALVWYFKKLNPSSLNHQAFCLTLAMMLFLSPFGWIYYFPLLIFPLALIWRETMQQFSTSAKNLWVYILALFLINFPLGYISTNNMPNTFLGMLFISSYFYGLLLLIYLLTQQPISLKKNTVILDEKNRHLLVIFAIILGFGVLTTSLKLLLQ